MIAQGWPGKERDAWCDVCLKITKAYSFRTSICPIVASLFFSFVSGKITDVSNIPMYKMVSCGVTGTRQGAKYASMPFENTRVDS
jgi:hypothetical protein